MLDGVSLDQLRTFIAAADEGSFSAAGRKLRRAQSVVSQTMANLEGQLRVTLFDRSARYPVLTDAGKALLGEAKTVVHGMDSFKARARTLSEGLEPELSVAVDVMFPMSVLTAAVGAFKAQFPTTPLRMYVEALGAVRHDSHTGTKSTDFPAHTARGSTMDLSPAELLQWRLAGRGSGDARIGGVDRRRRSARPERRGPGG